MEAELGQSPTKKRRSSVRRRALAPELRAAFDARVLAGEDIRGLAREFNFETWYATRRAERVLAANARKATREPEVNPLALLEELGPIEAAIAILHYQVRSLRDGTYILRGFRVGPRDVVRAANKVLSTRGLALIPYPGLTPLPERGRWIA